MSHRCIQPAAEQTQYAIHSTFANLQTLSLFLFFTENQPPRRRQATSDKLDSGVIRA